MKILIVRFSSIGDIVLTSPVVRCLKKQMPDAELHYLTKKSYVSLLENNPYIDHLHSIEKSIDEVVEQLKKEKFHYVIDLHHNVRTLSLKRKLRVSAYSFPKENIKKWLLVNFKIDNMPDIHIVDRYFEAVKPLHVKNDLQGIDYFIPKSAEVNLEDFGISSSYFVFAIGGQFATKKIPKEKIVEICDKIDGEVVIIGGKEDHDEAGWIAENSKRKIQNLVGKLSLNQSAFVISKCKKIITHDTGMMHIAAAFDKPTISIWGNTVPQLGMYSYQPQHPENVVIIEKKGLKCRPCSKIGYQACPKKHFDCMDHDTNEIVEHINS